MNKQIDGTWNRLFTLESICVSGVADGTGIGVTEWLVAGPVRGANGPELKGLKI
jgi:hypothetical protein